VIRKKSCWGFAYLEGAEGDRACFLTQVTGEKREVRERGMHGGLGGTRRAARAGRGWTVSTRAWDARGAAR
jgi:hypothetical protein